MFGDVVMEVPHHAFEHALEGVKKSVKAKADTDLTTKDLQKVVGEYLKVYTKYTKQNFPTDGK